MEALYYPTQVLRRGSSAARLEFETDMRWFVEVSRVGESSIAEKYCVEAKQWQAALQEARKLRGDSGALSKFSIELLDRGYRAVDPALKLRYLIDEAPADAPLSEERANGTSSDERLAESGALSSLPPSAAPASLGASVVSSASGAPRPNSASAPRPGSIAPVRPSSVPGSSRSQQLVVPPDPVPPAPRAPGGSLSPPPQSVRAEVPVFELVRQRAEDPRAESPITYRELAFAVQPGASRAQVEALLLDRYRATLAAIEDRPPGKFVQLAVFDHVFKRRPERPPLATFAWKDWRGDPVLAFPGFGEEAMGPMSQVPPAPESLLPVPPSNGHASRSNPPPSLSSLPLPPSLPPGSSNDLPPSGVPSSAPVIPMAPVILESKPPASSAAPAVAPESLAVAEPAPARAASEPAPAVAVASEPSPLVWPAAVEPPIAASRVEPAELVWPVAAEPPPVAPRVEPSQLVWSVSTEPPVVAPKATTEPPAEKPEPVPDAPAPALSAVHEPSVVISEPPLLGESASAAPAPTFELNFETTPFNAPAVSAERRSSPDRASRPRLAVPRRRAGEDLIGELFEIMHDLHFMPDVAAGADFVMSVLDEVLPCEGALVHIFDINTSHFVVVRAKGPNAATVLLQRMSDKDPFVASVMRTHRTTSIEDVSHSPRFLGPRWPELGVQPHMALCGPVQEGGRYLGLIELVNPLGDTPFHHSELNALDYICQQFAEFLSKKPIVLSADVVLAKS